jgi:hypothetical protein
MATLKVRHLVAKQGRFYWQPAAALRAAGWPPRRLARADGTPIADFHEAAAAADALNAEVDAWRAGQMPAHAPARLRGPAAGTVAALIRDYKASKWWAPLAPRTKRDYAWALDAIQDWAGDQPVRAVTPPAVQAFHAAQLRRVEGAGRQRRVIETPAKALAAVRVLRLLLQVGVRLGYVTANAAAQPGIAVRRQREPVLWRPDQVRHMAACADALGWRSMGTAILLNEWLGQRVEDVLRLPPASLDNGAIRFRQGKTGRLVSLPVHLVPHLMARLRAEAARPGMVASATHLLLHDRTGQPWQLFTFSHAFADVRALAAAGDAARGIPAMPDCAGLIFRELRHTTVTRLHEAGVDEQGIAGITGHTPGSVRAILDRHYLIRTAKAAEGAFRKRLAAEGEDHE